MITRRSLFRGLGAGLALIAAPAIVRASSLMAVKVRDPNADLLALLARRIKDAENAMVRDFNAMLYGEASESGPEGLKALINDRYPWMSESASITVDDIDRASSRVWA